MPSINIQPPQDKNEEGTCTTSDDQTCNSDQQTTQKQQAPQEPSEPSEPIASTEEGGGGADDGTQGIRTIPIPIPEDGRTPISNNNQTAQQTASAAPSQTPAQAPAPAVQQQQGGPGMRNLVRFLNNPQGAMAQNDSTYLNTMCSSDSVDLVLRSMNSSGYY